MASLLVGRLDRHVQFPLALSLSQYMSEGSKAKALHKLESYESSKAKGQARGGPGGSVRDEVQAPCPAPRWAGAGGVGGRAGSPGA